MERHKIEYKDGQLSTWMKFRESPFKMKYVFIIDTGAQLTVISEKVAEDLGFDVSKIKKTDAIVSATTTQKIGTVSLPKFEVFGRSATNFEVGVMNFPEDGGLMDGLIGNDFLEKFKKIKIHYDTQEVEVG